MTRLTVHPSLPAILSAMLMLAGVNSAPGTVPEAPPSSSGDGDVLPDEIPDSSSQAPEESPDVELLSPLPADGIVPPIVTPRYDEFLDAVSPSRARIREYERQLKTLRYRHFGRIRVAEIRAQGLDRLREFTDPASFGLMVEVFRNEQDDVILAMLDHFVAQGEAGEGMLAWIAIYHDDPSMRHEATRRLANGSSDPVLQQLDIALRSDDHAVASHAATLAGSLGAFKAIPLLIFGQAAGGPAPQGTGDLAWMSIETQRAYVAGIIPTVGSAAGAYVPIIDTVNEGTLMRVVDAVAIVYRTEVHRVLVAMTSAEMQQSTAHLNYDLDAWWYWYNDEYVPFKNEQIMIEALASD